ncbi:DUF58 domain-containing protein [Clostridium sp.]|uniref:DUF58 domain-containing protein n=1 Tax=Clostridium sp. TaxID=1506 RepID=UPI003464AD9B
MNEKIFDGDFFKKLEGIALHSSLIMNDGALGGRKSKSKGSSVEFSDFREYVHGDDFRRIDWRAYGRFEKLFIKLFMEEREAFVNIFLDCSKSMGFKEESKGIMALRLSAVFSYIALNNLDRVCVNKMVNKEIIASPKYMGKGMFNSLIDFLKETEFKGESELAYSLKRKNISSKGISIIITDGFLKDNLDEAINYLMYRKQKILFLHVLHEEELRPKLNGELTLKDSETGEKVIVSLNGRVIKAYNKRLNSFISHIKDKVKKSGGNYIQINSEDSLDKVIFENFTKEGII